MSYPWSTISRRRERMTKGIFIWLLLFLIGSSLSSPPMAGGEDNGKEELLWKDPQLSGLRFPFAWFGLIAVFFPLHDRTKSRAGEAG